MVNKTPLIKLLLPISVLIVLMGLAYLLIKPKPLTLPTTTLTIEANQESAIDAIIKTYFNDLKKHPTLVSALTTAHPTVTLAPFWVDKQEVKQGQFYRFIHWINANRRAEYFTATQANDWQSYQFYSSSKNHQLMGRLEVSANGISFYDAYSYCQAAGGRLPTQNEFFAISQGNNSRLYPWGDYFRQQPWVYQDAYLNATIKSGSFPKSNTPEGVEDVGHLLSEWTMGDYPNGQPYIQGGNAYSKPYALYALSAVYHPMAADYRSVFVGFRCVYDTKPQSIAWQVNPETIKISGGDYTFNQFQHTAALLPLLKYITQFERTQIDQYIQHQQQNKTIDFTQTEISVAQYQLFLNDTIRTTLIHANPNQPNHHSDIPLNWQQQLAHPERPVVGVDWWSAYHFSQWVGGRLPSEKEWLSLILSQPEHPSLTKTQQQGSPTTLIQDNPIPFSLYGNVSEWTKTVDSNQSSIKMIVKGGSFMTDEEDSNNPDFYRSISPHHRARDIGFRVVFD